MNEKLTGPDYLMVVADMLSEKPYGDAYKAMLGDAFPNQPESHWTEGQRIAAGPAGERVGLASLVVLMAAKMAIEREDWESLDEVIGTGSRMAGKFSRYLRATGRLEGCCTD